MLYELLQGNSGTGETGVLGKNGNCLDSMPAALMPV